MKKLLFGLLLMLGILLPQATASANNIVFSGSAQETVAGRHWHIDITLDNSQMTNLTAFQLRLQLPDGLTYVDGSAAVSARTSAHAIAANSSAPNVLGIVAYSTGNNAIIGESGAVLGFDIEAAEPLAAGKYTVVFQEALLSDRTGTDISLTTQSISLTSTYIPGQPVTHTLTYLVDGATYATEEMEAGTLITPPAAPEKEGHTFEGWEGLPETMPASDLTVNATFSVNSYTVTYYLDNAFYASQSVPFGSKVTPPEVTDTQEKVFTGWKDCPETMPAHDVEVYGTTLLTGISSTLAPDSRTDVYTTDGRLVRRAVRVSELPALLRKGLYIIGGRTVLIR